MEVESALSNAMAGPYDSAHVTGVVVSRTILHSAQLSDEYSESRSCGHPVLACGLVHPFGELKQ